MKFKKLPKIAIIIPVYNVIEFLDEAIESAINQTYKNKEIIVINDGSSELAKQEIEKICGVFGSSVKLIHQNNLGAANARNTGVENTNAEFVVFLDGDDALLPYALKYLSRPLLKSKKIIAAYAKMLSIDKNGKVTKKPKLIDLKKMPSGEEILKILLAGGTPFSNGSICIRKISLNKFPKNNEGIKFGEDWILWCYLALLGNIVPAGRKPVFKRRLHENNCSDIILENPSLIGKAIDVVYNYPVLKKKLEVGEINALKNKCISSSNLFLAINYAKTMDKTMALKYLRS